MMDDIFRYKEDRFEFFVNELDVAYDKMFNNYSQEMHDSLRQIDIELYRDHPQDEDSYYERHNSWYFSEGIYESLYGGISRTFERNKAKQFESYKTTANSFFLFIRENWDDQYLQTLDSPIISNSILIRTV